MAAVAVQEVEAVMAAVAVQEVEAVMAAVAVQEVEIAIMGTMDKMIIEVAKGKIALVFL
jgi:hypothetical protein